MLKRLILCLGLLLVLMPAAAQRYKLPQDLADPNGQFLTVGERTIYVQTEGDSANPAVVLLHGFGGSTFTWRGLLTPLAEAGFYVVALDLPPFGLSSKEADADYSRSALADVVVGAMDELDIETAIIAGHSMGGGVTAYLGARHPERVDGLIFVAGGVFEAMPANVLDDEAERENRFGFLSDIDPESPLAATLLRTLLTPARFTDILESAYVRTEVVTEATIAGYQRPLQLEDWPQGILAFSAAEEPNPMTLEELAEVVTANAIPVLILWGADDTWVPLALGETMHAAMPDSQIMTYDGVGHIPMEEDAEAFNADVIAFAEALN